MKSSFTIRTNNDFSFIFVFFCRGGGGLSHIKGKKMHAKSREIKGVKTILINDE